jgi:uncharacterized protein (TIGR02391 family)
MNKKTPHSEQIPPSLSKEQGQKALLAMKDKGDQILKSRPIPEATFDTWSQSAFDYIKRTFGSRSGHLNVFNGEGQIYFDGTSERQMENDRAKSLHHRISVLANLIEQLETEIKLESPAIPSTLSTEAFVWSLLHPKVVLAGKPRFEAGHYADAVEAAFKELNGVVKEMVKKKTGQEFDGAALMQKAFSPNPPVLVALDDLSTESGKNIQQGYMQIFAGAITGIRNPKAHENLTITKERAIHHLFLASLLFKRLDERP